MLPLCLITTGGKQFHTLPLPCSRAPVTQGWSFTQICCPDFCGQSMPLYFLVFEAKRNCVHGYHGTVSTRETVFSFQQSTTQKALHRQQLKHTLVFERGLFTYPGTLVSGENFWFDTHLVPLEVISGNRGQWKQSLHSLSLPRYSSLVSPRKDLISLPGAQILQLPPENA